MNILVTGSNGLLGQKLVKRLLDDSALRVTATARTKPGTLPSGASFRSLDITDTDQVDEVMRQTKPDVLINTAAATHVDWCEQNREDCLRINTTAVQYLADACNRHGAHLMQISTDFVFNGNKELLTESDTPEPVNYYGTSKLLAEQYMQRHSASWCIIRTVLVYGVAADISRSNIVLWVKKSLEEGKPIQVVNDQWRTPTLAEDLASGCYLAAKRKVTDIYHISGEELMTPYEIAIRTAEFFKLDKSQIKATDSTQFKQPAKRPLKTGFSISKAKRELGYSPHSFTEGLSIIHKQLNQ
ncbi:NAD(P)-dependent oxidoreductase [Oscillatoria amoena NRMC-F 0135]|nr:NAD(P)-dependent oxidoreductase [Oscillatoria amoena NRMC-F 0135]